MSEERFDRIDGRLDRLEAGQRELTVDVTGLKTAVVALDNRVDTLDRHMHVLHEDTLSRIAAMFEEPLATKREMNRGFAELKELILRRIEPLEVAVRGLIQDRRPGQP